ncbi:MULTISPECIES: ABC transporter permease [unclassified Devosia]|uniref:FtsX-like permease family protein n=1 Tax=unclassified Devosia TaxID=196773 RepID=UPI001557754B|nr:MULTISPECIES: ABC transporter permease [unclassified Devosia]
MNPWPIVLAALLRYRMTVLAFIVLIVAGTALSVAIVSQERALKSGSAQAAEKFDVVVAPVSSRTDALLTSVYLQPGSSRLLSPEMTARVLNDERAAFTSPLAFGDSYQRAPLVGATAPLVTHLSNDALLDGRVFEAINEAVVGASVPLQIGTSFTPAHGTHEGADLDHAEGHDVEITVVGRMAATGSPWDRAIVVPVELVWDLHGLLHSEGEEVGGATAEADHEGHDHAHEEHGHEHNEHAIGGPYLAGETPGVPAAVLKAASVADAYRLRQEYNTDESMAFFPAEVLIQLYQTLGDVRELMTLMALVTQALVMLSIVASVLILFRLLMPQFVTLRAIGAPKLYIFAIAWGFIAVLFTVGVSLGLGFGYLLSLGLSAIIEQQIGIALRPSIGRDELLLAGAIWVLGLVIALLPAWHLQSRPLAQAMKAY